MAGSSPLTRGKLCRGGQHVRRDGLIPAHAGKTPGVGQMRSWAAAHPRSRGENTCGLARADMVEGSSPLTRGKRDVGGVRAGGGGLIPAHAGKTTLCGARLSPTSAHPRSRGENHPSVQAGMRGRGSSPLTRGKRPRTARRIRHQRLIPAHAGKTSRSASAPGRTAAHPRSRGENGSVALSGGQVTGSSPLTRGKPTCST